MSPAPLVAAGTVRVEAMAVAMAVTVAVTVLMGLATELCIVGVAWREWVAR